nr:MAG TPA: hypothetical protein [Bacteriophage sp.]
MHDVFINGVPADIKRLSSHNHIVDSGKHATQNQGAKMVLFEFTKRTDKIQSKIEELSRKGIHGKYFFSDNKVIRSF